MYKKVQERSSGHAVQPLEIDHLTGGEQMLHSVARRLASMALCIMWKGEVAGEASNSSQSESPLACRSIQSGPVRSGFEGRAPAQRKLAGLEECLR